MESDPQGRELVQDVGQALTGCQRPAEHDELPVVSSGERGERRNGITVEAAAKSELVAGRHGFSRTGSMGARRGSVLSVDPSSIGGLARRG